MYQHFREIEWFPSKQHILGTLPHAFYEKYPTTVALLAIFIETPSDLMLQSISWSNYKHHNTLKILVACTPNGSISYVSPAYLGSVSDPAITKDCGFLDKLTNMQGTSVMADQGFTIRESLRALGIDLNLPPFMEGRQQLSAIDVQQGRSIASLRIHVERAIGRIKQYKIMKKVFPLKMARLANQIVSVSAYLSNFNVCLVPPPTDEPDAAGEDVHVDTDKEEDYDGDISETSSMDTCGITLDDEII